jgi:hypothetical protein
MKRPLSVTIVGWFFIAAGAIGFFYHLRELMAQTPLEKDAVWILTLRLLAIAGGVLVLNGKNTGRWLLIAWLAYHVVLSYFHEITQLITHAVLLIIVAAALFYGNAGKFFLKSGK